MILILDNFDSFTFTLADYFHQINILSDIQRNDVPLEDLKQKKYKGIILSPGPGKPENAGNLMEIIDFYHDKLPILGICLGHQAIGQFFGAKLQKALQPMHGKISEIHCKGDALYNGIPSKLKVVRYHSLILNELPKNLESIGVTIDGEIMAIKHVLFPIYGLQYHPEAILTEYGKEVLNNWIILHKITD